MCSGHWSCWRYWIFVQRHSRGQKLKSTATGSGYYLARAKTG